MDPEPRVDAAPTPRPAAPPRVPAAPAPTPPAGEAGPGSGIFAGGRRLDGYTLRPGSNILPVLRAAMNAGNLDIEVRLDPGERYFFTPSSQSRGSGVLNNLSLAGANLRLVSADSADADGSGGYAEIELTAAPNGRWSTPLFLGSSSDGSLLLDGISFTAPTRNPDDFINFITWRGGGRLDVVDSRLSGARNNISISGAGGPSGQGPDVRIHRTIVTHANAPDRDLEYEPGQTGGPSNGIYASTYRSFRVSDSVFYHNGWRDDAFLNTHASAYSHGLYLNIGNSTGFDPSSTVVENTIFSDNGANAAQFRRGGIFRDNLVVNSPFGVELPSGQVLDSAFVQTNTVWPRDGVSPEGYQRWRDRGGYAIQVDHDRNKQDQVLGAVTIRGNVFADSPSYRRGRGPIHHDTDPARPQRVVSSGNYELNWTPYEPGGAIDNFEGGGIDRFNRGDTRLNGAFGGRFDSIDDIVDAAVNRDRGGYESLPEARDLAGFYLDRARAAAG